MILDSWIERLSKRSEFFSGLSACPYARKAKTVVHHATNLSDAAVIISRMKTDWPDKVVIIVVEEADLYPLIDLAKSSSDSEFIVLEDHPDQEEFVNDIQLNHGELTLLIMQTRKEIEDARKQLKSFNYYANYSQEDYEDLMSR